MGRVRSFVELLYDEAPRDAFDAALAELSKDLTGAIGVGIWTFFFSELFGTSVRYTGASVGYQLASIFAGALAPVITVIAVLFAKETAKSSLRHDRVYADFPN